MESKYRLEMYFESEEAFHEMLYLKREEDFHDRLYELIKN